MSSVYDKIIDLCNSKGIKPGKMCTDTGLTRGTISDLKMGRRKELSTKNLAKISEYFGISIGYFFESAQKEKPISDSGNELIIEEIKKNLNRLDDRELQILLAQIKGLASSKEQ